MEEPRVSLAQAGPSLPLPPPVELPRTMKDSESIAADCGSQVGQLSVVGTDGSEHALRPSMSRGPSPSPSMLVGPASMLSPERVGTPLSGVALLGAGVEERLALRQASREQHELSGQERELSERSKGKRRMSLTEAGFKDIVDDLAMQNQELKSRLRRYEAKIPNSLRQERLFEVKFFEGLSTERRGQIEHFLTSFVQNLNVLPPPLIEASTSQPPQRNTTSPSDSGSTSEVTSGVSGAMRSLRGSEKQYLAGAARGPLVRETDEVPNMVESSSASEKRKREVRSTASSSAVGDLRELPPIFPRPLPIPRHEKDTLAAGSYFGHEPPSATGTGYGMKIKQAKPMEGGHAVTSPPKDNASSTEDQPLASGEESSDDMSSNSERERGTSAESLTKLVVDLIERLFQEAMPAGPSDDSRSISLKSEPYPLPHKSGTNAQYLSALLSSPEVQQTGGWLYLNLILTMAGMHRLNVSIQFVRQALALHGRSFQLSSDGGKLRWTGGMPREPEPAADGEAVNQLDAAVERDAELHNRNLEKSMDLRATFNDEPLSTTSDTASQLFTGVPHQSTLATTLSKTNTKTNTNSNEHSQSVTQSNSMSKEGQSSNMASIGSKQGLPNTASLRTSSSTRQRSSHEGGHEGGKSESLAPRPSSSWGAEQDSARNRASSHPVHYVPRFDSREEESDDGMMEVESQHNNKRPRGPERLISDGSLQSAKRQRRDDEGGLLFFSNNVYCCDWAGDPNIRADLLVVDQATDTTTEHSRLSSLMDVDGEMLARGSRDSPLGFVRATPPVSSPPRYDPAPDVEASGFTSSQHFCLSGMTNAVPQDNFAVLTKTAHPTLEGAKVPPFERPWMSRPMEERTAKSLLGGAKDLKYAPPLHAIHEVRVINLLPASRCRLPRVKLLLYDSDSQEESSGPEKPSETSSDEAVIRKAQVAVPQYELPPGLSSDYALSLGMPLNFWAPHSRQGSSPSSSDEEDDFADLMQDGV